MTRISGNHGLKYIFLPIHTLKRTLKIVRYCTVTVRFRTPAFVGRCCKRLLASILALAQ